MPTERRQVKQVASTSKKIKTSISSTTTASTEPIDLTSQNYYEKVYDMAEKLASTSLGQFAIQKMDGVLSVVEKTAKWSLPQTEQTKNNTAAANDGKDAEPPQLERPCGWIPFLSLIIALRVIRVGLSVGSLLIGNEPVAPSSMVYFIQTRRRKLRAIKYHGLRAIRLKQQDAEDRKRRGVIGKITSVFNLVVCRPGKRHDSTEKCYIKQTIKKTKKVEENHKSQKEMLNSNQQPTPAQKRPLEVDGDSAENYETDDELPCDQLLEKYGNKESDDSDFVLENKSESSTSMSDASEDEVPKLEPLSDQKLSEISSDELNETIKSTTSTATEDISGHINGPEKEDTKSSDKKLESEVSVNSELEVNPTSVSINPVRLSPKIAQNGSGEDDKYENFYDPVDVHDYDIQKEIFIPMRGSFTTQLSSSGGVDYFYSPIGSPAENMVNHTDIRSNTTPILNIPIITTTSSLENNTDDRTVDSNQQHSNHINENSNTETSQNHHPNQYQQHRQPNNKRYNYNNTQNHYNKYTKGRKAT